ncbi:MAG: tRNA pseudouridine(55) synthase TruB [Elusimicrobia bacterium]|nr:tRNA pseudouridine(55) synthase TruB [Elusimicrobiota bacterium]
MEGLLLADKPRGWTSHDVVAALRRRFPKGTKVGHCGTLDPMATGLLILLVGRATSRAQALMGLPKVYCGRFRLGIETETGDLDGRILREAPIPPSVCALDLRQTFEKHLGEVELPIPKYSAVKFQGRPLYSYARRGVEVPERMRSSRIESFDLLSWAPPEASFRLRCSSGTYVRSIAASIGRHLGCGAALSALRREAAGPFRVERARSAEELARLDSSALEALLAPAEVPCP